jgi:hypothetical protein
MSLPCLAGLDAVTFQLGAQISEVLMVPRLDSAQNVDRRNIRRSEGTIVHDFLNARARGCDLCRQIGPGFGNWSL